MLIGVLFEVLMAVRAHLFKIDGRVVRAHFCILTVGRRVQRSLGAGADVLWDSLWGAVWGAGDALRWWFGILFGALVDFRKIDGWVSSG